ncbi:glycosyltransferase [Ancylobacter sp. A5.8]|uniref:glycosyltransferase n=1 Tax=Ancylobacter gelatini TaxID=2919920 RepID=UPI001F4D3DAC|nr:glycosyltransferase [Ancylobacter gelatini]MCJ8145220.1 glycosyltransferase [Ancylobacter gelatini]
MDTSSPIDIFVARDEPADRHDAQAVMDHGASSLASRPEAGDATTTCTEPKVFVHLAWGQDAREWERRWHAGRLIGVNDPSPYGYARAREMGCRVTFSRAAREGRLRKLVRLGLRAVLGFDYLHAAFNADNMLASDIVWTHTESQYLAVALLLARRGRRPSGRPKLIGQSVWMFDRWDTLSVIRRALLRRLIREVDLLTTLSMENLAVLRRAFPQKRSEMVLFGIPSEVSTAPRLRTGAPARVISVGNDRHRDWRTLAAAMSGQPDIELTIVSQTAPASLARGAPNIRIVALADNDALQRLMADATLMVVPLQPNRHASGITVMQEAALRGLPMVVTDTGGLKDYFDADAACYTPPGDAAALLANVRALIAAPDRALALAQRAQARMRRGDLGCHAYIARHVELTRSLLGDIP